MAGKASYIEQLEKQYKRYLQDLVNGVSFNPIMLRGGKSRPDSTADLYKIVAQFQEKEKKSGHLGWTVSWVDWSSKKFGLQQWPSRITIETEEDFLFLVGKKQHAAYFKTQLDKLLSWNPSLKSLLHNKPEIVNDYAEDWPTIMPVIDYLVSHDVTHHYIRSIPVPAHTKFLHTHNGLLLSILKCIQPEMFAEPHSDLAAALKLKRKPVLFSMRLLDASIAQTDMSNIAEFAISKESLQQINWPITKVILVENETNLYLLPSRPNTLAIFSSGKALHLLHEIDLLHRCKIFYWGDLDDEGFAMLNDIRQYYPHTRSLLMDIETVAQHEKEIITQPARYRNRQLNSLTPEELAAYNFLSECNGRIEQERLKQDYFLDRLAKECQ